MINMRFLIPDLTEPGEVSARSLKFDTLGRLRWLAILGQVIALTFVQLGLGYTIPVLPCVVLIAASIALNLALTRALPANYRLTGPYAATLLAYDACQLGALLFFTGGLDNPFSFLLLAPVLVSAATLPPRATFLLGLLVAMLATLLAIVHWPLPWGTEPRPVLPPLYLISIWIALLSTLAFSAIYAFRVADEARQLADALAAAELVLVREQHLSALDGLAAAAAHELGTPLGTIAVVARELELALEPGSPFAEDVALLRSQSDRCREILRKLTQLGSEGDQYFGRMALTQLIEEVVAPFRGFGPELDIVTRGRGPEPIGTRNPGILYGIGNIVENAVDFANGKVRIEATWDAREVGVTISDDGPGFHPAIIARLGEPFVTSRAEKPDARGSDEVGGGLGLGYFIAKTFLIRSGAKITYSNKRLPETGAIVRIIWPRDRMDNPANHEPLGSSND
ncbi:MAG: ActS/PrrB/RegB family redox-sensitive histidine kinase [Ancalomicrobiaceae bacterium]|nr:ActS/PrrB/RegB family redox-sensitive histidine kinase [Ancalomicrobiaceae bacterium]